MCRNSDICALLKKECRSDAYTDFYDGRYYKTHPLFTAKRHALQVYYDDFWNGQPPWLQTWNSLFCWENLASQVYFNVDEHSLELTFSYTRSAQLWFWCYTGTLDKWHEKKLESQGLSLPFSDEQVYGTQITGDNLEMHTIVGFNESFNSRHFCHICLIEKNDCQIVFSEDDPTVVLRGKDSFELHYRTHKLSHYMVWKKCYT